jgi:hypothetical protein
VFEQFNQLFPLFFAECSFARISVNVLSFFFFFKKKIAALSLLSSRADSAENKTDAV